MKYRIKQTEEGFYPQVSNWFYSIFGVWYDLIGCFGRDRFDSLDSAKNVIDNHIKQRKKKFVKIVYTCNNNQSKEWMGIKNV